MTAQSGTGTEHQQRPSWPSPRSARKSPPRGAERVRKRIDPAREPIQPWRGDARTRDGPGRESPRRQNQNQDCERANKSLRRIRFHRAVRKSAIVVPTRVVAMITDQYRKRISFVAVICAETVTAKRRRKWRLLKGVAELNRHDRAEAAV